MSNAPLKVPLPTLLLVAFSRWRVERCFGDEKGELGLDHYEGRKYQGLKRHMILTSVSPLFLAKVHQDLRGGNPELTVCQVRTAMSALVRSLWLSGRCVTRLLEKTVKELQYAQARRAQARKRHTKATRRKLHAVGVRLTTLTRCCWAKDSAL